MENNNFYSQQEDLNKEIIKTNDSWSLLDLSNQIRFLEQKISSQSLRITNLETEFIDKNLFLSLFDGTLKGNLNLNKNTICNLTTPEKADPFYAANVGFVLGKINQVHTHMEELQETNTQQNASLNDLTQKHVSTNTEIESIRSALNICETQMKQIHEEKLEYIMKMSETSSVPSESFVMASTDLNMQSHYIYGIMTPETKNLDYAANVAFVKSTVDPLSAEISALYKQIESNTKSLCNIQLNFMPTTGGFLYGNINMQNHKITGLKKPSQPSDAVSLEYLDQVLGKTSGKTSKTLESTNNLLYSTTPSYQVSSPLPLPLIKSGYVGWTWTLSSSYSGGYYQWSNLNFEQTNPESNCFEFSIQNPHELLLKKPGEYIFSFSLVALIPASMSSLYPSIHLNIQEDFSLWGKRNQFLSPSSGKSMTLHILDRISILGVFYDIVELPPLSAHINTRVCVSPKEKPCAISLQNISLKNYDSSSLYIVQNNVKVSWVAF